MKKVKHYFYTCIYIFLTIITPLNSEHDNKDIHLAVKRGNIQMVKSLLEKNPRLMHARDTNKDTPLHIASAVGHVKMITFLLEKGADINGKNYLKYTPLHLAAMKGHDKIVRILVQKGADTNSKSTRERVPAFCTIVAKGKSGIIKYLIENGTDINTRDFNGSTLLARACERKYPEIVDLLLDKGVYLPTDQKKVVSLINYAAYADQIRLFKLLLVKNQTIDLNKHGNDLLRLSAQNGSLKMTKILLDKGYDPSVANFYGNSSIHLTAKGGHKIIMELILGAGEDINKANTVGKRAFHIAKEYGHEDMVQFLIKMGAKQDPPHFPKLTGLYFGQKLPGEKPEIFAPGIVSTEILEHSPPVFSKNGKEVYWATDFPMKIMHMQEVHGKWSPPTISSFHSVFGDSEPVLSYDNNKLFFLSTRSEDGTKKIKKSNIWFVQRKAQGWSKPKLLSKAVNSRKMHWTISLDSDNSLYFASAHGTGYGAQDIYKTVFKDGSYQTPQNLGPSINSKLGEITPYMAPDNSYLIYAITNHPQGRGKQDLFVSIKDKKGAWSKPANLGPTINTSKPELCPVVTPDGKYLFFLGGGADIYWVNTKRIDELKENIKN